MSLSINFKANRESIWLLTFISLFTGIFAFLILMMNFITIEGRSAGQEVQKVQRYIEHLSLQAKQDVQLDWLGVENTFTKGIRLTLQPKQGDREIFALGSAKLTPLWEARLAPLAKILEQIYALPLDKALKDPAALTILIEGHTDAQPMSGHRFPSNWELSTARAQAVQEILVNSTNIPASNFGIAGLGSMRPKTSIEDYASNRRIEIYLKISLTDQTQKQLEELAYE